jgi:hypothetical protein
VLTYGSDWEKSLYYAEFSYNKSYQASLKMAPFEALYGKVSDTVDVVRGGGANLFRSHHHCRS